MGWAQRVVPLQDVGTRSTELLLSPAPSPQCEWLVHIFELSDPGWDRGWLGGPRLLVQVALLVADSLCICLGGLPRGGAVTPAEPLLTPRHRARCFQKIPSLTWGDKWSLKFTSEEGEAQRGGFLPRMVQGVQLSQHEGDPGHQALKVPAVWSCTPHHCPPPA